MNDWEESTTDLELENMKRLKITLDDTVYIKIPCTVVETHEDFGNRSGLHRWLVLQDEFGNEYQVTLEDVYSE